MNLKKLAKAIYLQEEIEKKTQVLDALNAKNTKFDIWIKTDEGDEFSIMQFIPLDLKTEILQMSRSAIENELKRMEAQFDKL
jgi:oligoribonuclease NrnB/cAMP/cGMP phosphodiesterase (DHH superfamily)